MWAGVSEPASSVLGLMVSVDVFSLTESASDGDGVKVIWSLILSSLVLSTFNVTRQSPVFVPGLIVAV